MLRCTAMMELKKFRMENVKRRMMLKIQELREAPAKVFFGFRPESFKWEQESDKVSDAQEKVRLQ